MISTIAGVVLLIATGSGEVPKELRGVRIIVTLGDGITQGGGS